MNLDSSDLPVPRVLAIVASRVFYGQERANLLVLENLRAMGCEVLALVEDHPGFPTMPQELQRRGIAYVASPIVGRRMPGYFWDFVFGNPLRFLRANRRMRRWIREFRPTHVHIPNPFCFLTFMFALRREVAVIYRIGDKPSTHNVFWRWLWRRIVQRVDQFVAISEFIAGELLKLGVSRARISVIYNVPPTRQFLPIPDQEPVHPQHMIFIGQITADKGLDWLVQAFAEIAEEFPKAQLTIAGRISEWSGDAWARDLRSTVVHDPTLRERIKFVGEVEDIYGLLATASFIVVPSVWEEPLSNVVGEAKSAARPAVIFPRGGLPELVTHEIDGYICHDTSVAALAEGLRYYLANPARTREQGRAALGSLDKLGVTEFCQRWRAVYDSTMPDPGI
jgi:glycosyltransferase involved in cell wall biosynthesis